MSARALSVWPPLPPSVWLRRPSDRLPFPLEDSRTRRFARGRTALWHGVGALRLEAGDEVLVPAYHHGSEVEALTSAGLVPRFYSTRTLLQPDLEELASLITRRTRALLVIHVLGLVQATLDYRRWCTEHELLLLEDVAQGWLAEADGGPAGSHADLALFCLYKTFGIPGGAAVIVQAEMPRQPGVGKPRLGEAARANLAWVAQRSSPTGKGWRWLRQRRRTGFDPAAEIALGDTSALMSSTARALIPRLVAVPAASIRRAHYRLLFERLGELVPAEMPPLLEGASPFAFPVWAPDKRVLLSGLARAGIHALDFWSLPHPALDPATDPVGARLREHVIGLPVHQELEPDDVDRIATAVLGFC